MSDHDLRTLLAALPAIRARIEAWQPVLDDWRNCSDETLQALVNAVSYHDDLRSLLSIIDYQRVENDRLRERLNALFESLINDWIPLDSQDAPGDELAQRIYNEYKDMLMAYAKWTQHILKNEVEPLVGDDEPNVPAASKAGDE